MMKQEDIGTLLPEVNTNQYQLLTDWVAQEIIGPDESDLAAEGTIVWHNIKIRNQMRARQRENLNKLLGGTI